MKILSIETSCDETALAMLSVSGGKAQPSFEILSHNVASQVDLHAKYGGVFPAMAKREHAKNITPLFIHTLREAKLEKKPKISYSHILKKTRIQKLTEILAREPELFEALASYVEKIEKPKVDAIAVTVGPGLEPTLWVGINFARALSYLWDIPIIPVNHMEGHILSTSPEKGKKKFALAKEKFPLISLLVSGGHTEIVLVKKWGAYKVLGSTRDDAAGEAFDKVARMMDLPYPGGPRISHLAEEARKKGITLGESLPRPMINTKDFDFSFSGLKTAVLYLIKKKGKLSETDKEKIAREFEDAAIEVLVKKTMHALAKYKAKTLIVGGGVAANAHLRTELGKATKKEKITLHFPTRELSTDNAIMIGIAGAMTYLAKKEGVRYTSKRLRATGNMEL